MEKEESLNLQDVQIFGSIQKNKSLIDGGLINQAKKDLRINKETFDNLKILKQQDDGRTLYELVYSRHKALKDDNRLIYYSYNTIFKYTEMYYLGSFSIFYVAGCGIAIDLANPYEGNIKWPFDYYAFGCLTGLGIIIIISDFLF